MLIAKGVYQIHLYSAFIGKSTLHQAKYCQYIIMYLMYLGGGGDGGGRGGGYWIHHITIFTGA